MRVYLAGPMTGIPYFNFPAFDAAEADLLARGYDVVPPADLHDEAIRAEVFSTGFEGKLNSVSVTWGECLANDVKMIADDGIEGIFVMEGWERSRGARLEVFVGLLCGLPIYHYRPHYPPFGEPVPVSTKQLAAALLTVVPVPCATA